VDLEARSLARKGRKRGRLAQGVYALVILVAVLVAIPAVLVPVYGFVDPVSMPMLARLLTGQPMQRQWRDSSAISDRLKASVIMSEDGQFCRHWGIDANALRAEIGDLFAGKPARGASTISMQVARNLFLWNDRSFVRKGLEVPLALYIDLVLPKRRIMEIYLNIAEWGPGGIYGVQAGAKFAFGKNAGELSWSQASLLTIVLPNPVQRLAAAPTPHLRRVAAIVEKRARAASAQRAACV
jgi:monofunctional biosynthetic peptidoglycan transglycosylase